MAVVHGSASEGQDVGGEQGVCPGYRSTW